MMADLLPKSAGRVMPDARSSRSVRGVLIALLGLFATAAWLPGPAPLAAQEDEGVRVGLTYTPGFLPGLVMPEASGEDGMTALSARVDEILRRDLDYSDRFEIVQVPDSLRRTSDVNYGLWNQLGAVWLVEAEVTGTPDRPVLRLVLHDVVYGSEQGAESFPLPASGRNDEFRMAVHRAADDVVEWATGERGMAASRIAFRRKRDDGGSDIYMVDSDGRNLRQVTHDSTIVYSPAFSPEGDRMLYVSYREGDRPAVYERDLRTGRDRIISNAPGMNLTPTYRPDGDRLMLARSTDEGTEIFEMGVDPLCCSRRITYTATGDALNPSYAPQGDRFAFEATPLGQQQIYVQRVGGGGTGLISRYVYGERGYATSPEWSPTGDRIVYQAWVEGVFQIVTVDPDGGNRRVLTSRGTNQDPSWAPDGRHVVFTSDRGGYHGLWVLDTVTGRLRPLVENQVAQLPAWSGLLEASPAAPTGGGASR